MSQGMPVEIIDIVFAVLIIVLVIRGIMRGFIEEIASMAALILGVWAALIFRVPVAAFIRSHWLPDVRFVPDILGFLAILIAVFLLIKFIGLLLKGIAQRILLGGLDRLLGAVFGLLEGLTLVCLVLLLLAAQPLIDLRAVLEASLFARYLLPLAGVAVDSLMMNAPGVLDDV
ncbi:MAG: CvpA family protein [Treponema sp.]|jgi:membrane protein required for colicin V production|nr:CvpA family protein [Treponema sp.]